MNQAPDTTNIHTIRWASLILMDPELATLHEFADQIFRQVTESGSCTCHAWYFDIKPRLRQNLGPERTRFHPILSSEEALDEGYHELDALRPPCCEDC